MKRRTFLTTGLVSLSLTRPTAFVRTHRRGHRGTLLAPPAHIDGARPRQHPPARRRHGSSLHAHPNARIELWQANAQGQYDLEGFAYRARVTQRRCRSVADRNHRTRYLNGPTYGPAHIHAKVITTGRTLTTQLYFPGDPFNANDPWFDAEARFDFVV